MNHHLDKKICSSILILLLPVVAKAEFSIIINEVAWMGTETSSHDEWIELQNVSDQSVNLQGWRLTSSDGSPDIGLSGMIEPNGFYLLERTDDTTVHDISADLIYTGSLNNNGEDLTLFYEDSVIDRINGVDGWGEGDNRTKRTMERAPDKEWRLSLDPGGTPRTKNSPGFVLQQSENKKEALPLQSIDHVLSNRVLTTILTALSISLLLSCLIIIVRRKLLDLVGDPTDPESS